MTDHSSHGHPATPGARRACRTTRNAKIKALQAMYMKADEIAGADGYETYREYAAMVDLFSMDYGMDLRAAYELVENGPIIN